MALGRFVLPKAAHRHHLLSNALFPFEPIVAKHFNRMLRADVAVSTIHRIGGTIFIASPTISFGMLRVHREFLCHLLGPPRRWKTRRAVAGFAPSAILALFTPVERRLWQLASGFALLAPICRTRVARGQNKTPQRSTSLGVLQSVPPIGFHDLVGHAKRGAGYRLALCNRLRFPWRFADKQLARAANILSRISNHFVMQCNPAHGPRHCERAPEHGRRNILLKLCQYSFCCLVSLPRRQLKPLERLLFIGFSALATEIE